MNSGKAYSGVHSFNFSVGLKLSKKVGVAGEDKGTRSLQLCPKETNHTAELTRAYSGKHGAGRCGGEGECNLLIKAFKDTCPASENTDAVEHAGHVLPLRKPRDFTVSLHLNIKVKKWTPLYALPLFTCYHFVTLGIVLLLLLWAQTPSIYSDICPIMLNHLK